VPDARRAVASVPLVISAVSWTWAGGCICPEPLIVYGFPYAAMSEIIVSSDVAGVPIPLRICERPMY
jgi:hypothetical protein